jgi:hypothetical protein
VQQTELLIFDAIYLLHKRQYNAKRSGCCGSKASLEVKYLLIPQKLALQ